MRRSTENLDTWDGSVHDASMLPGLIVASSHDAIVAVNLRMEILAWNPAAEQLYGYRAADVLGTHLDVLIPAAGRDDEREVVRLIAEGGQVGRYRTRRLRVDGALLDLSVSVSPVADTDGRVIGVTSTCRAIGDRERADAAVQAFLEAAPDAIVGVGADGLIVMANTQAERLFDRPRHGLVGRDIDIAIPAGLPDPTGTDQPATSTLAVRTDGSTLPVEITVSLLDIGEGPVRCAVIRDITERLQAQAEETRLRAEADRVRIDAQLQRTQRLESLGQLAGGIAHDFNNLVAVILNYAAFVTEEAAEAGLTTIVNDAEQIMRAGQRGAELTHQLLAFARREVVRPRVLDLNQIVTEVEQMLRRSIGGHITLVTRLAADLPATTADPGQLEQVLVNLAVNGRDAMPGGGQLTIDTGVHEVDADYVVARPNLNPGRYAQLRVSDTGAGMPRDVVDRAFEPFFTTKASGEGTGLGLATVYGIVTQAGGDVSIQSELGMGTTITILLPTTDSAPTDVVDDVVVVGEVHGETILVVEDEPALRQVVHRMLSTAGYEVLVAEDGPSAFDQAMRYERRIDLVLTDVVMPHMLGTDLARQLAELRGESVVLYMSGYARPVLASHGTLDSDVHLLEKPFTRRQLLAAVRCRLDDGLPVVASTADRPSDRAQDQQHGADDEHDDADRGQNRNVQENAQQ
jgi:PAS domain S-box-containing protein